MASVGVFSPQGGRMGTERATSVKTAGMSATLGRVNPLPTGRVPAGTDCSPIDSPKHEGGT